MRMPADVSNVVVMSMAVSQMDRESLTSPARAGSAERKRPVMVAIVGDSAAGKTTLTRGIANILGPHRVTVICTDDYHRYGREARKGLTVTPLHPDCNYMDIMDQHLRLLALGEPILKPVYNHTDGSLDAPELIEPSEIVVVEGLLATHSKAMRDCFDVKVYLDPPEELRREWKIRRDCQKRGYDRDEVLRQLEERETDSNEYIRPQRKHADIVVRFHPGAQGMADGAQLSVKLVLRPTLPHPYLLEIAEQAAVDSVRPIRLALDRDAGKPVDILEVDGETPPEVSAVAEDLILDRLQLEESTLARDAIGTFQDETSQRRSESLAMTQLLLVYQLKSAQMGEA
jgi:phosphoribulokinase